MKYCRETRLETISSLEEAAESSPGRKPGVGSTSDVEPRKGRHKALCGLVLVSPFQGFLSLDLLTPGSRPGLISVGPSGLGFAANGVSRQYFMRGAHPSARKSASLTLIAVNELCNRPITTAIFGAETNYVG